MAARVAAIPTPITSSASSPSPRWIRSIRRASIETSSFASKRSPFFRTTPRLRFSWSPLPAHRLATGFVSACLPSAPKNTGAESATTRLFVSGLSFRTTEDSLRSAFQNFGQLVEVNLVMDRIANRPRGFAFVRYATVEESKRAIEGMHGKFLDGRVIFVEFAKNREELREASKRSPRQY